MAYQIIQQPNGLFAVWSTKTDSLVHWNLSEDGLEGQMAEDAKWDAKERVREMIAALKRGETPHHLLAASWEEAKHTIPKEDRDKIRSAEKSAALNQREKAMYSIIPRKMKIKITIEVEGTNTCEVIAGVDEVHFVKDIDGRGRIAIFSDQADAEFFEKTRPVKMDLKDMYRK